MTRATYRTLAIGSALAAALAIIQAPMATASFAAQSHHSHHRAPARSGTTDIAPGYAAPFTVLPDGRYINPLSPACTEDEGNGRVTLCDGAG